MAQSKREQMDLIGSKAIRTEKNTVPDLLLQQHRVELIRAVAIRVSNRLLLLAVASYLVLPDHLSLFKLAVSFSIAVLIAYLWFKEMRILKLRLTTIEKTLTERSGEDWEDVYIKSRYRDSEHKTLSRPLFFEPIIWSLLILILGVLRFYLEKNLGF